MSSVVLAMCRPQSRRRVRRLLPCGAGDHAPSMTERRRDRATRTASGSRTNHAPRRAISLRRGRCEPIDNVALRRLRGVPYRAAPRRSPIPHTALSVRHTVTTALDRPFRLGVPCASDGGIAVDCPLCACAKRADIGTMPHGLCVCGVCIDGWGGWWTCTASDIVFNRTRVARCLGGRTPLLPAPRCGQGPGDAGLPAVARTRCSSRSTDVTHGSNSASIVASSAAHTRSLVPACGVKSRFQSDCEDSRG